MKWTVHGRRALYQSEWVSLWLDDVETPSGNRFDHHVVRVPKEAVNVAVVDDERHVLMLRRHRFITDTWGWELPAGWVDADESAEQAARREVTEETGYTVSALTHLTSCNADNGLVSLRTHLFLAHRPVYRGPARDTDESDTVRWIPLTDAPALIRAGEISDAPIMATLLLAGLD